MTINDLDLYTYEQLKGMKHVLTKSLNRLDYKIRLLTTPQHMVLSEHGLQIFRQVREGTALRLGAVLNEMNKRERERYANSKKRSTIAQHSETTTGTAAKSTRSGKPA